MVCATRLVQALREGPQGPLQGVGERRVGLKRPHEPLRTLRERALRVVRDKVSQVLGHAAAGKRHPAELAPHVRLDHPRLRHPTRDGALRQEVRAHGLRAPLLSHCNGGGTLGISAMTHVIHRQPGGSCAKRSASTLARSPLFSTTRRFFSSAVSSCPVTFAPFTLLTAS